MTSVVEIVVRFDRTIIDIQHVAADGTYRIGTAPAVDMPVLGLSCFPLIDHLVLRRPVGARASRVIDGRRIPSDAAAVRLLPGFAFELELGSIAIAIAVILAPRATLPPPAFDRRPPVYLAAALAAHLLVWAAAEVIAPPAKVTTRPRPSARVARIVEHEPPARPVAEVPIARPVSGPRDPAPRRSHRAPHEEAAGHDGPDMSAFARSMQELAAAIGDVSLDGVGPAYREYEAPHFGGAREFDPATRAGFGTVTSGRFPTVAAGREVGDDYDVVTTKAGVEVCAPACTVAGGLDGRTLRRVLEAHAAAFVACGVRGDKDELALEIDASGAVVHASSSVPFGRCMEDAARSIAFPRAAKPTMATAGLLFE